jgi:hypothetical protein
VTKAHKVTACQGEFKRSRIVMETYAINGILNVGAEKINFVKLFSDFIFGL